MGKLFFLLTVYSIYNTGLAIAPKLAEPPHAKVVIVSDWMAINGVATHVRKFTSKLSVERVIRFYQKRWDNGREQQDYGMSRSLPPWTIMSIIRRGYLLTVQATQQGARGSIGYLSISQLSDLQEQANLGHGFPKMKGTEVLNDINSNDGHKDSRTVVLFNKKSVRSNVDYYRHYYQGQGWNKDMDAPLFQGKQHTLRFSNGNKHVTLAIVRRDRGTAITAQWVKEGIL